MAQDCRVDKNKCWSSLYEVNLFSGEFKNLGNIKGLGDYLVLGGIFFNASGTMFGITWDQKNNLASTNSKLVTVDPGNLKVTSVVQDKLPIHGQITGAALLYFNNWDNIELPELVSSLKARRCYRKAKASCGCEKTCASMHISECNGLTNKERELAEKRYNKKCP